MAKVGRERGRWLTRRVLKTKAAPMHVESPAQMTSTNAMGAFSVFSAAVPMLGLLSAQQSPVVGYNLVRSFVRQCNCCMHAQKVTGLVPLTN